MPLSNIKKIKIPEKILDSTFDFLRKNGTENLESHALWVGKENNHIFPISDVWFPKQFNSSISYEVPEDEEFLINRRLYKENLEATSQIHTHPASAYHSSVDDEGSEMVLPGSLSIVIPNFGFIKNDNFSMWKVYRYNGNTWSHVSKQEVMKLFQVI